MSLAKVSALLLIVSAATPVVRAGYGCCEPIDVEISLSQQRELDVAAERRYQKKRDAERAQRLALEELQATQYQAALAEQRYELEQASARKRQERRDEELAQRIAQQELDVQRRLLSAAQAEQQRLLDEADRKAKQSRRDEELALRIAQQELDAQRRLAQAEQQRLLDEIARKSRQERQDAQLAHQIAQQDLAAQRQIASDAALAQQLFEEELRSTRPNTRSQSNSSKTSTTLPVPATRLATSNGVSMTTALPSTTDANSLQNWLRTNDVLPTSILADDTLCVVCLSSADDLKKSQLVKLPCRHVFCRPCTQGLIANKSGKIACPLCRAQTDVAAIKSVVR